MPAPSGITVSRGSLSQWANRAVALLKPVHEAQWRSVLESAVIQTAGTPVRAGRQPGSPGSMKKGYFRPVLGDRGEVVFPFSGDRRHRNVADFLGDYAGTLAVGGCGACGACAAARGGAVTRQGCRVHTRRNFRERKDSHPETAGEALELIGAIYGIEEEIRDRPAPGRLAVRRTRSRKAVDRFRDRRRRTLEDPAPAPRRPVRRAVACATGRRATPEVFPGDPDVPLDTNLAGNSLRAAKLGQRSRLFAWTELGAENTGIMNAMFAACRMQGAGPRVRLADVLLRIDTHPASRACGLTPGLCRTLFADSPMASDVAQATAGRLHAAARGAVQRLRRRWTAMPVPAGSAESPVPGSAGDLRPGAGAGGEADRPCSSRLARMKHPPCPQPGTLTVVRRRLADTYRRPPAGFSPRWADTSALSPSKPPRMSAGSTASQMPPAGQPPGIRAASGGA